MGETYNDVKINIIQANEALKRMKEIEKSSKMYSVRLNKNTIVCCKNKDKIKDYKKL